MEFLIFLLVTGSFVGCFFVIRYFYLKIRKKKKLIVQNHSNLYKSILEINKNYTFFNDINTTFKFNINLKSKRSLENLNFIQYIEDILSKNYEFYDSLAKKVDNNITNYAEYNIQYYKTIKFTKKSDFKQLKLKKIKFRFFKKCEKEFYSELKHKEPQMTMNIMCHATYTSPSGRNSYWRDCKFDLVQIKRILKNILIKQQEEEIAYKRKLEIAEQKKEKEAKLRNLDRFEQKLSKREKEILQKEEEFNKATKNHIYSSDNKAITKKETIINENLSITRKLRLLKEKLDNGEISYDEYEKMRMELL